MTLGDYLDKNISAIQEVRNSSAGATTLVSICQQFDLYKHFKSLSNGSKMQRYIATSVKMRVSESTVRNAVREMEKHM